MGALDDIYATMKRYGQDGSAWTDADFNSGRMVDTSGWSPEDFQAIAAQTGNYAPQAAAGSTGANNWVAQQLYQARHPATPEQQASALRNQAENAAYRSATTYAMGFRPDDGSAPDEAQALQTRLNPTAAMAQFYGSGYSGADALRDGWLVGNGAQGWNGQAATSQVNPQQTYSAMASMYRPPVSQSAAPATPPAPSAPASQSQPPASTPPANTVPAPVQQPSMNGPSSMPSPPQSPQSPGGSGGQSQPSTPATPRWRGFGQAPRWNGGGMGRWGGGQQFGQQFGQQGPRQGMRAMYGGG